MTFEKHIKKSVETTLWESVFYTNLLSLFPMFMWATAMQEYNKEFKREEVNLLWAFLILIISSCVGVGIGYSSWNCRSLISATSFTLVGVVNKFLTIFVNVIMWDQHANMQGICGLVVCLLGATFYQQAPLRESEKAEIQFKPISSNIEEDMK